MTTPEQARLRVSITPAMGPEEWFGRQLTVIRSFGAQYDSASRTWFRWLATEDPEDLEELASALTEAARAAREFGAAVRVETDAQVRAGEKPNAPS